MKRHLVTACIFCLLCATHAPCSAHQQDAILSSPIPMGAKGTVPGNSDQRERLHEAWNDQVLIRKIFNKFSDGKSLNLTGFENLLKSLKLEQLLQTPEEPTPSPEKSHDQCVNMGELVKSSEIHDHSNHDENTISVNSFQRLCPLLLYQLTKPSNECLLLSDLESEHSAPLSEQVSPVSVWLYSTLSIIVISLCGLLGVAVIPVMQKTYYQQLLQFLVALAVGTLCGDALLHLLPHAMMSEEGHSHTHSHNQHSDEDPHSANMWKGLVAAMGVVFFFFTEKCLALCAEWRKKCQRKNRAPVPRVRVMRDTDDMNNSTVGEKLCKHKYSSYPFCYGDITKEDGLPESGSQKNGGPSSCQLDNSQVDATLDVTPVAALTIDQDSGLTIGQDTENDIKELKPSDKNYTIIIREHKSHHHGHSHTHGHVHSAPSNLSSVAWMVVMGDGLHNFTDGMAIGAAFAANIAGGFSTAVAVFCHELPHELGDFAVLLKAGMSAKQAVFYNLLSSVLCFFGMCLGIFLGNTETASQWIFAVAAGMFLYIALVDMIPELTTNHSMEGGSLCQCLLQLIGLLTGIGIMLLIANYEHDLKNTFTD